ncbi:MAG: HEAT repeat domain-containing protein, partial [Cyanobacteria bacterium P01_F01_bin.153]
SAAIAAASALGQKKDPAGVDALILAATTNDSALVRRVSTVSLKFFDDPKAIAVLIGLMTEGEGEVVAEAQGGVEFAIGQKYQSLGPALEAAKAATPEAYEKAFSLMQTMLQSPEEYVASSAIGALGKTGDPRAVGLLVKQLESGTDFQRQMVVGALGGIDSPESIAALKKAVTDENTVVSKAASGALRKLGYVDLELIKAELEQYGTRDNAIATLGKMNTPESLQLLATELKKESRRSSDRDTLISAIASRSEPAAVKILLDLVKSGDVIKSDAVTIFNLIGDMGKKSQDSSIPSSVIAVYRAQQKTLPVGAIVASLAKMGDIAYKPTLALLSDKSPNMRMVGAAALGGIGNQEAIAPLKAELTDWNVAPKAAASLKTLGWTPEGDREQVLLWLASRDKKQLTGNWETTKTVLLAEASNGNGEAVSNALYGFVGIGDESVVPDLKKNLNNRGNKEVALAYLNCGQPELEAAAKDWANRNGYQVIKTPGATAAAQWGRL